MGKGFKDIGTQPFTFSKALLSNTIPDCFIEEVFIAYKVNLWEFQSHLEAFNQW
jgi:hypothetical protein